MEHWYLIRRLSQGVFRRRKLLTLLCFILASLGLAPVAYHLSQEPPRYRTSATILLEARPTRVPVFQEFSPVQPPAVQMAILRSRALAESVMDSLPKSSMNDLIENPYYVDYWLAIKNLFLRHVFGYEPVPSEGPNSRERALKELQAARIRFETKTDGLVELQVESSRPQLAVDLANTYIEVLLARTRSFNADDAKVSRDFLAQQGADAKRSLAASEEALRAFTAANGGVRIPERSQATALQLSQAESSLAEVEVNRKMIEARLSALREKFEEQKRTPPPPGAPPRPVTAGPSGPAPEVRRHRDQLAQLETTLLDLRGTLTEEHPRVVAAKNRIAEIQRLLGNAVKETTVVTPAPAAVRPAERVNFAEQVLALETSFHAITAQEEALRNQVAALRRSTSGLSRSELEYGRLTREVESHRNLYSMLSERLTAARIREQGEMNVVKVIDPPRTATSVTNEKRVMFFGGLLGIALVISAGVPIVVELLRKRIETEQDVHEATDLPVLAVVPRLRKRQPVFATLRIRTGTSRLDQDFMFCEAFRSLRVAVQMAGRADGVRSVLVASAFSMEGKSTVVMNLGFALSEAGIKVLLADTDFLRPTLHRTLEVPSSADLDDLLQAKCPLEESLIPAGDGMWVASPAHGVAPSVRGSLATNRLKELIQNLATKAEITLCDSPPVLVVPESLFLASATDAVILVAKAGSTACRDLGRAKAVLEGVGARILGVVINEMPAAALKGHYKRYYAGYHETIAKSHGK